MSLDSVKNNQEESLFEDWRFSDAGFEVFFKKFYPGLCIYCKLRFGVDIYQAEDIVNTAFIKLWQARQTIGPEVSAKSYLYKIINNTSLNFLKHQKVVDAHEKYLLSMISDTDTQTSFDSLDLKQLRELIDISISELPEQMRKIFELSRFEGLKYAEIASELDISVKTVETQMSRALSKLREKLSGYLITLFVAILSLWMKL